MQNERNGKYDNMFEVLQTLIGKEVTCIYGELGLNEYQGYRGTLESVNPYDSITINGTMYEFIGERTAIVHLSTVIDGKRTLIYLNGSIQKPYNGYFRDPIGLIHAQEEYLGYSVKSEEMSNSKNNSMSFR